MFKLFERQPNWALKQLVTETDQPAVCLSIPFCLCSVKFFVYEFTKKEVVINEECYSFDCKLLKKVKQIDIVHSVHMH